MRTDIFTINATNLRTEESFENASTWRTYYDEDSAIESAEELAKSLASDADVYNVSVFVGEYEDENSNVFGESFDIYTISNKGKEETMIARKECGYCRLDCDDYIED